MDLKNEITSLAGGYPPLEEKKLDAHIQRLERMAAFYRKKSEEAPERQASMFTDFVYSINYSITVLKMHRKLTVKLGELSGESKR